ncbi:DUF58 domain-containing protein [Ruminococcaceae bacterium OttesenSCG-928-L11]|nr:DUF58 domain-containing protein [Ruminococcaceae bacterium OttesenSCG-928-L11]
MKQNRILYGLFLVVLIVFLCLSEDKVLFPALYCVLLLGVVSLLFGWLARAGISLEQSLSADAVTKGETCEYTLSVKNRWLLPLFRVRLEFAGDNPALLADMTDKEFHIPPRREYTESINITAIYRGVHLAGLQSIQYYDWLGLFRFRIKPAAPLELTVLPRVVPVGRLPLQPSAYEADTPFAKGLEEDYGEIADLRRYQPSDGVKRIHWKLSAKRGVMMSKRFQTAAGHAVTLALDSTAIGGSRADALRIEDAMLETCVSVLAACLRQEFTVRLAWPGAGPEEEQGFTHFPTLCERAAAIVFEGEGFEPWLTEAELPPSSELCVFARDLTAPLLELLYEKAAAGYSVLLFAFTPIGEDVLERLRGWGIPVWPMWERDPAEALRG